MFKHVLLFIHPSWLKLHACFVRLYFFCFLLPDLTLRCLENFDTAAVPHQRPSEGSNRTNFSSESDSPCTSPKRRCLDAGFRRWAIICSLRRLVQTCRLPALGNHEGWLHFTNGCLHKLMRMLQTFMFFLRFSYPAWIRVLFGKRFKNEILVVTEYY